MGSISRHITPLVINSLGGGHTHTRKHTYRRSRTGSIQETRRAPAAGRRAPGLKKLLMFLQKETSSTCATLSNRTNTDEVVEKSLYIIP